jgi:LPS-assembly lipoprotein
MHPRRRLLVLVAGVALGGCGFQLRQAPKFAFSSIYVTTAPNSSLGKELKRSIASSDNVRVVNEPAAANTAQVVLDVLADQREKVVVGLNASGQVREFQLRTRFRFRLRTPQGKELIPETELLQQRDISFSESAVLAKEAEENLLYRDMQTDIVQQLMRRLAAVKTI